MPATDNGPHRHRARHPGADAERDLKHRGRAALAAWALLAPACGVGDGRGQVEGSLWIPECIGTTPYRDACASDTDPRCYRMNPRFFAGEPIEDISTGRKQNRLIIRLQPNGARVEVNDALTFDVLDNYEVARCVRGLADTSGPLFDTARCAPIMNGAKQIGSRVRVGPDQVVRSTLTMLGSCQATIVGVAQGSQTMPSLWESWIELVEFGKARPGVAPGGARGDLDFKVDFGERIHATAFHVTLRDDRALKVGKPPEQDRISGDLSGYLDLDLLRGRAAQAFP